MDRKIWQVVITYLVTVLVLAACAGQDNSQNILDVQAIEATAKEVIRQTADAIPTATLTPTITQTITPVYPPTEVPPPTTTPTPTITITSTPRPTNPPAASVIMGGDTNCRGGPSSHYDWLGYIFKGETAYVVGKAAGLDYWLIENPDDDGTCWIWGAYATLEGDINNVPNKPIPPTRTPTKTATPTRVPSARLNLDEVILCNGEENIIVQVYNTSRVELRSYRILVYGQPGRVEISRFSSDQFSHDDQECALTINNLDPFRIAYARAPFDPTGYNEFSIDIQVCTDGGCVNDFLSFDIYLLTATPTYTPTPTRTPTPTATATATETPITPSP